jgi:plasmid maintenance system killer protein
VPAWLQGLFRGGFRAGGFVNEPMRRRNEVVAILSPPRERWAPRSRSFDMTKERERGFYWVRVNDEWQVAEWTQYGDRKGYWSLCGVEDTWGEPGKEFTVIEEVSDTPLRPPQ